MPVYMIICDADKSPITGTGKYYVGKTSKTNLRSYLRIKWNAAKRNDLKQPLLSRAMRKYSRFEDWRIQWIMPTVTTDSLANHWEREMIAMTRCRTPQIGYNITKGGEGTSGVVHSPEWRAAASKRMTGAGHPMFGKHHSDEAKALIKAHHEAHPPVLSDEGRAAIGKVTAERNRANAGKEHRPDCPHCIAVKRLGRVVSQETRDKISKANIGNQSALGAVRSEETRRRIGAASKARNAAATARSGRVAKLKD
jgi:hypothetical protein